MTEKLIKLIDAYRDACFNVAKHKMNVNVTIATRLALETYILRYKRALEGLTPGGSEFVDDPEFCERHIRARQTSQHEFMIKQQKTINLLREGGKCTT